MGPETVNRLKDSEIHGDFVGRDKITNIIMFQESEREFVVTHNANIKPVSYFTGREVELQELRQRIAAGRKSVLVSGMGGIGKTHICRKLFEEYLNKHVEDENGPFRHLGYIEYNGDMGSSLQNCLKFKQQDSPEQNQEAAWRELEYLAADGKLLLFVDNVDKSISADPGLQKLKEIPGAIVLTSRQASFGDEFDLYWIGFLDMEQCKEIYEKIRFEGIHRKVDPDEIGDLEYVIEALAGRHTITVELLAHLARTKLWTVKRLRYELEEKGFRLTFHKAGELVNIQESYEKLYDLSELTEAEQNILEAFSVFPYIPLAAETCNKWLLADASASEGDDILMGLYQKGWLQFDLEHESYALHPVFAQFVFKKCEPNIEKHRGLIRACQSDIEIPDNGVVSECKKAIPFVANIIKKMNLEQEIEATRFIDIFACLLMVLARYEEAVELNKISLQIKKRKLGENHPNIISNYNNLAKIYMKQGKYRKVEELTKQSIKICENVLGESHRYTAIGYNNLAATYAEKEEYRKAEKYLKKSVKIYEETMGENHLWTASGYNNLATVYCNLGDIEKAEELYIKAIEIREKVLGENHPDVASSYNNLAELYRKRQKFERAKELYKKAIEIHEKVLGENHPDVASNYNNLATVYCNLGDIEKAEELYIKAIKIREKVFGKNHPDVALSYNNLATVYEIDGQHETAIIYFLFAFIILSETLGINHPKTQSIHSNLKKVYCKWNSKCNFELWLKEKMEEE